MRVENTPEFHRDLPLKDYMTPLTSLMWAGMLFALIAGFMPLITASSFGDTDGSTLLVPIVWVIFWLTIRPSIQAFGPGGFGSDMRKAFYDSLKRPPKEESGPR